MKKYISPKIEISELDSESIMAVSGMEAVTFTQLEGVDTEDSKSAIFNVNNWFIRIGK